MKKNYGLLYALPGTVFLSIFLILPLLIIFVYSFMTKDINAGVIHKLSLDAYKTLFRADYVASFFDTIEVTIIATFLAFIVALPAAYYMARSKYKNELLLVIIVPFWTNFLVRIFAWKAILEANGFLNLILIKLNIIDDPIIFLYNRTAVIIVLAYTYLPFMVLPLYSAIEKFDFSLLEAAEDLGCNKQQAFFKVLIPSIKSGIFVAILFAAIPIFGQYVISELIGGGRDGTFMLGQKIANAFFKERNWPLPAAFATLLTVFTLLIVMANSVYSKKFNSKNKLTRAGKNA